MEQRQLRRRGNSSHPQFKQYLGFLLSRHPSGISAGGLIAEFLRVSGSPLSYEMYGYGDHLEMFRDLTDVFTMQEINGENILYPPAKIEESHSIDRSPLRSYSKLAASLASTENVENEAPKSPGKTPQSMANNRFVDVGKVELKGGGNLVYVKFNGKWYVPSPCVASLAGLQSDTILQSLKEQHIEIHDVEVLRESERDHSELRFEIALINCPLVITKAGTLIKEIPLIPWKSLGILLLAFGTERVELEKTLRSISESFSMSDRSSI
ncbi:uncharacterized protein LOC100899807 [Galendromus occidentalis]|uniref:Uncharacterized protein LOC100899807 n=1 Tax=Galendromus occidentalis TaxID=34638 RepID=A0AAJ6W0Z3_9ACAR|nr:uncharacterized protein LOC100899807 [Galendromus occidentalis]